MSNKQQPSLVITGRPVRVQIRSEFRRGYSTRYEVVINGRSVALSGMTFFCLVKLAAHTVQHPGEYLATQDLDVCNEHRYIWRLREELLHALWSSAPGVSGLGANGWIGIENLRGVGYRVVGVLAGPDLAITFDREHLLTHPDVRVRNIGRRLSETAQGVA